MGKAKTEVKRRSKRQDKERSWTPHNWEEIGHIGDGNEYMVCICKDCGCRATPPDGQRPDDTKYPPCKDVGEKTPKKRATKKKPSRKTAWDILRDGDRF